jgi:hypothetical protein
MKRKEKPTYFSARSQSKLKDHGQRKDMNVSENFGRWPPVYDFNELGQQIKELIDDGSIFHHFFIHGVIGEEFFQGDIITLKSDPVYIDSDGDVAIIDEEFQYWVILGNTCDLARDLSKDTSLIIPQLTHISPLIPIPQDIPDDILGNFKKYKLYKRVFIPRWGSIGNDFYIDLTIINSIEKQCLIDHSNIAARLNFKTWLLLHSCLVRYLARDDGRHD